MTHKFYQKKIEMLLFLDIVLPCHLNVLKKMKKYVKKTVNEKMWKDAEMKDIIIKVERTLKETAIDCSLNKNINFFDKRFKEELTKIILLNVII